MAGILLADKLYPWHAEGMVHHTARHYDRYMYAAGIPIGVLGVFVLLQMLFAGINYAAIIIPQLGLLLAAMLFSEEKKDLQTGAPAAGLLAKSLLLAAVAMPFISSTGGLIARLIPGFDLHLEQMGTAVQQLPLILRMLFIALLPAVCEEFFFRGLLLGKLKQLFHGPVWPVLISSLWFAAFHLDPYRFAATFMLGLLMGTLVYYGKSLWLAVAYHLINNMIIIVMLHHSGGETEGGETPILFIIASGILIGIIMQSITKKATYSDDASRNACTDRQHSENQTSQKVNGSIDVEKPE